MEPHSSFDLGKAIATWRAELARHPGPAPADLRELEAHLREAFAELLRTGLSAEEAFLIARHRIGPTEPVAAEFAKRIPQGVWRSRIFWLIFAFWGQFWWRGSAGTLLALTHRGSSIQFYSRDWMYNGFIRAEGTLLSFIPLLVAIFWLARGVPKTVASLLSTRSRVAATTLGMMLLLYALRLALNVLNPLMGTNPVDVYTSYVVPAFQIALLIWLTPGQKPFPANVKTSIA